MLFPKDWKLDSRLNCWLTLCIMGWLLGNALIFNFLYRVPESALILSVQLSFFIFLLGVVVVSVDYKLRKIDDRWRWVFVFLASTVFFMVWNFNGVLIAGYLDALIHAPFLTLAFTTLSLAIILIFSLVAEAGIPLLVEYWKNIETQRRERKEV